MESGGNGLSGLGEQLITAAYVFGISALAFASLPFLFMILRALMKSSDSQASSMDIIGIFLFSFLVHFVSCLFFMTLVKMIDSVNSIYGVNYLQSKVFPLFWTEGKQAVISAAGAGNTHIAEGAYSILFMVQIIRYWTFLITPLIIFFLGFCYGVYQQKKDRFQQSGDYLSSMIWGIGSATIAAFLFVLWAKIASFALFIPDGADIIDKIREAYSQILNFN